MEAGDMRHPMKFIITNSLIDDSRFMLQKPHNGRR